jgi:hypothetical protein
LRIREDKRIKMAEKKDLKKHFEAILGRKLELPGNGGIVTREQVGTSIDFSLPPDSSQIRVEVEVTSRDIAITGESKKICNNGYSILDVSGGAVTGADGSVTFPIADYYCYGQKEFYYPVNFVATPQSSTPVYLTSNVLLTGSGSNVLINTLITVYAWNKTGDPAPGIFFNWLCRIPYTPFV